MNYIYLGYSDNGKIGSNQYTCESKYKHIFVQIFKIIIPFIIPFHFQFLVFLLVILLVLSLFVLLDMFVVFLSLLFYLSPFVVVLEWVLEQLLAIVAHAILTLTFKLTNINCVINVN